MPICFVNNGVLDFGELTDLEKQWHGLADLPHPTSLRSLNGKLLSVNLVPRAFSLVWGRVDPPPDQGKGPGNEVVCQSLARSLPGSFFRD